MESEQPTVHDKCGTGSSSDLVQRRMCNTGAKNQIKNPAILKSTFYQVATAPGCVFVDQGECG